jgi:hypothetical protein
MSAYHVHTVINGDHKASRRNRSASIAAAKMLEFMHSDSAALTLKRADRSWRLPAFDRPRRCGVGEHWPRAQTRLCDRPSEPGQPAPKIISGVAKVIDSEAGAVVDAKPAE